MTTTTYKIEIREVPTQRVATIRERVPMATIGEAFGEGFGEVARAAEAAGVAMEGMPFAIYHEMPSSGSIDLELGIPVAGKVDSGSVHHGTLEGGRVACTVHVGPYEGLSSAYEALTRWVQEHGERVSGPPRELYLNEPAEGVVPMTEVQMPLA